MPSTTRRKQQRLPAPERRKRIIAAAREVFMEQGFSGARTKEIAERAGVTEAFLYRHFESKDEMYAAAVLDPFAEGFADFAADVKRLYDEYQDPVEFIDALNRRALTFYAEFGALQAVALYAELTAGREFYARTMRPTLNKLGQLIAKRVGWADQGLDQKIVRRSILGAQWAIGIDYLLRHQSAVDVDKAARNLTAMFTGGIKEKGR
jgi:AcrR family transcriptional regulator